MQLSCRGMCKFVTWLDNSNSNCSEKNLKISIMDPWLISDTCPLACLSHLSDQPVTWPDPTQLPSDSTTGPGTDPVACHGYTEMARGPFHKRFSHHNSNSMEISFCSHPSYSEVIIAKFCTWHNSCAKFCHDMIDTLPCYTKTKFPSNYNGNKIIQFMAQNLINTSLDNALFISLKWFIDIFFTLVNK